MLNDSLVSVIVPIYNVEDCIEKCVDSIINQTYQNLEIILINDGSTDRSREKIQKYERDSRFLIIDKFNEGASAARNIGLNICTGNYICFIDSDDYIHPHTVEILLKTIKKEEADFCCYRMIFYNDKTYKISKRFHCEQLIGSEAILKDALLGKNIKTTVWSKFFSAEFLHKNHIRFYKGIINEDFLFTILCTINARKVAFLNKPLYYALERTNSISRHLKKENITSYFSIFEILQKEFHRHHLFPTYKEYYYASFTKQILYTLVQAVFKLENFASFCNFYKYIQNSIYENKNICRHVRLLSYSYWLLYKLSLHPRYFYWTIRFFKFIGVHMY